MESLDKKFYRISEVGEILGIPASTLRFWEKHFTLIKPRRNSGGTRFYTADDIEKIRMIHFLVKEKGMKLEAAEAQLRQDSSGYTRRFEAIERLRGVRARLNEILLSIDEKIKRS